MKIVNRLAERTASLRPRPAGDYENRVILDRRAVALHLRLEEDGTGLLSVEGSPALALNPRAAEYAYCLVGAMTREQAAMEISTRHDVSRGIALEEFADFADQVRSLAAALPAQRDRPEVSAPIPNSYWVEPGRLLAGEYPCSHQQEGARRNIDALLRAGIDTFIDLTQSGELDPYEDVLMEQARQHGVSASYRRHAIQDFGTPSRQQMATILDELSAALAAGHGVYVHCWGGVGRTGTTIGCYLVQQGLSGEQALARIARWWQQVPKRTYHPRSPETRDQIEYVRGWTRRKV